MGVALKQSSLRFGLFGAEPWSDAMRRDLQERLGIKAIESIRRCNRGESSSKCPAGRASPRRGPTARMNTPGCVYRKLKPGRSDGEVRPKWRPNL